jgi:protein O-mannosyl-transferase
MRQEPIIVRGAAALVLIVLLIYGHTLRFGFTNWDDPMLVLENTRIQSLSPGIFLPEPGRSYQPIREFSYAIDHTLWGLRPAGYHALNVLLHASATVLLLLALVALLDAVRSSQKTENRWLALGVAALWACHPVNTEAVVWVASRKYGLLACFVFASLWMHLRERRKTAAGLAAMALMSSPFAIVLPVLLALADWCRGCELRKDWTRFLPLGIAWLLLAPMIAIGLFGAGGAVSDPHVAGNPLATALTMARSLFDYGVNLLCPLWLSAKYPNRVVQSLGDIRVWLALAGCVALIIAAWRVRAQNRLPLFAVLWALVAWLPVSNIIAISTTMADRYLYLPGVGLFLLAGLAAERVRYLLLGIALVFGLGAMMRAGVWRDSVTLWEDALAKDIENPVAHSNLGDALDDLERYDEAADHYRQCLAIFERHVPAQHNLARYHIRREEFAIARTHALRATELDPELATAWNNLGVCDFRSGQALSAIANFAKSIELDPTNLDAFVNLGLAKLSAGDSLGASAAFSQAAELSGDTSLFLKAARTLTEQGQNQAALPLLRRAIALEPKHPKAHRELAVCLLQMGDLDAAVPAIHRAISVMPASPEYAATKAQLQALLAQIQKADR